MHVLAISVEMRLPGCTSLKDKRSTLRPIIDGIRNRHHLSVAEIDHNDQWQRAAIGVAVVSSSAGHAEELADGVERFVWSRPDVEVITADRHWLEMD